MSHSAADLDCDVAIVGAGQAGAALAALLARHAGLPAARILLLAPDAQSLGDAPPNDAPCDARVVALSRASQRVLEQADAWQRLPAARLCAYERMRVWHASLAPDGLGALVFDAAELGEPSLGVIVENAAITRACLQSFAAAGGVTLPRTLHGFDSGAERIVLQLDDGRCIAARLLVGADGAESLVRERLGIDVRRHAYGQTAIVANVATARPHAHTAWQRFLPTGPVALLPLFNGECSLVWSADDALAERLLTLSAEEFAARLTVATDGVLGEVQLRSARFSFPLQRATARRLAGVRAALIGDAAHRIHPLAGQGINLGFLDAAALCEAVAGAVAEREDPGSARILRRYEQQRLSHDTLMSLGMSAFNALFSQAGVRGWAGAQLLALAGSARGVRRLLAQRAMGLGGGLPRLARPQ